MAIDGHEFSAGSAPATELSPAEAMAQVATRLGERNDQLGRNLFVQIGAPHSEHGVVMSYLFDAPAQAEEPSEKTLVFIEGKGFRKIVAKDERSSAELQNAVKQLRSANPTFIGDVKPGYMDPNGKEQFVLPNGVVAGLDNNNGTFAFEVAMQEDIEELLPKSVKSAEVIQERKLQEQEEAKRRSNPEFIATQIAPRIDSLLSPRAG